MKISLVVPVFNEENINVTLEKINKFIKKDSESWEVIFVNDGSTDNTLEILDGFKPRFYKILTYPQNRGKGFALKRGIAVAKGDYICFLDSDLPYSFSNLKNLLKCLNKFDIVIGSRSLDTDNHRNISFSRRFVGKGSSIVSNLLLRYNIKDTQCGMKAFRKGAAKDLFSKQTLNGWYFDTEILYLAKKRGYKIKEEKAVVLKTHQEGMSRVKIISDSFSCFFDLIKIRTNDFFGKYK